jgi:hypothetical protein
MENINEKNKFKNIFLFTLYYTFIVSFFVNELIPHKFNVLIFMVLIPFVYSKNIFSLKHYLNLTNYFLINIIVLIFYIFELNTVLNILQILMATFFFSCLGYGISVKYNINEFIEILIKNLIIIFFISIILTTILTLIGYPFIINYYFWNTFSSDGSAVFKILTKDGTGHSSANTILPVLFCLVQYNFFKKDNNKKLLSLFLMILFACLAYLTQSRTTLFLIILILLSSFTYLGFSWFEKYFKIFIIIIGFLFLSLSAKPTYSYSSFEFKILDFVTSLDLFTGEEKRLSNTSVFFSGRDKLNQYLLSEISKKPFFGIGHNDDVFKYGVGSDLNIAYNLKKSASSESIMVIPAKYGLPYFLILIIFIIFIPFSFYNLKKNELALFQNFWSIIFISTISSGGLLSMYGISGFYFLILCILYFFGKTKNVYY